MNKPILFLVFLAFSHISYAVNPVNWIAYHKSQTYNGCFYKVIQVDEARNFIQVQLVIPENAMMGKQAEKDNNMHNFSFLIKPFNGMPRDQFLYVINNTPNTRIVDQQPDKITIDVDIADVEYRQIQKHQQNTQPKSYSGNIDSFGNVNLYEDRVAQSPSQSETHKIVVTTTERMEVPIQNNIVMAPRVVSKQDKGEKDMGVLKWSQDISRDMKNHKRKGWDNFPVVSN